LKDLKASQDERVNFYHKWEEKKASQQRLNTHNVDEPFTCFAYAYIYLKQNRTKKKVRRCYEVKKTYPRSRKVVERQKRGKMRFESLN